MTEQEFKEIELTQDNIESMIYIVRGQKIMLDFDLARIYGYETKRFNEQVKNNIGKFPEDFMFQLTKEETENLRSKKLTTMFGEESRCKNCTTIVNETSRSKKSTTIMQIAGIRGGRVYLPYAFTEQGIYMLMTVLKGDLAIKQSKALIRLFKKMKDFIIESNSLTKYDEVLKLVNLVNSHDSELKDIKERLEIVMDNFIDPATYKQFIILNGEKIEAAVAYQCIYSLAKKSIFIIDDYISIKTLNLLLAVNSGVGITIVSDNVSRNPLKEENVQDFIKESGVNLIVKPSNNLCHDRLIVIDYKEPTEKIYLSGSSSKDAGNKITTVIAVDNKILFHPLIEKLIFDK